MPDWESIVSLHGRDVWRTAYRLLGNQADAGDCVQETFLSALVASRRRPVERWGGFLRRLATARALDRLRQRARQVGRGEHSAGVVAVPSRGPGPDQQAEARELGDRLRIALIALPKKQAEAFCLHYLDGLSCEEIATQLGIKANAVGSLLHRARTRLREILGSELTCRES